MSKCQWCEARFLTKWERIEHEREHIRARAGDDGAGMKKVTLPPCLYCGGARWLHDNDWADPPLWSWQCSCGLSSKEWPTRDEAIIDANRRAPAAMEPT
jgi:hypothetical protein